MCLREILLTANSSVTRQLGGKDSAGMGQSRVQLDGSLHHQPHHAPTLAILHRLINCVLRPHHASEPPRLDQCVGLTDFNSFSQTVKATIKKLVVPLYTSR